MPEIFPIGGGKGGVGKSFISANLGVLIAKRNQPVVLIDLDLGGSNLHTFLGVKRPKTGIHTFLSKQTNQLESAAVSTPFANLSLISSVNCSMEIANLYHAQKIKLINAVRKLPYDYIILDLGAGTNFNTLDFFLASDTGVFVCTPDPTSIENAFRFIKAAYLRRLKQIIKGNAFDSMVKDAVLNAKDDGLTSTDIIELVLKYDPEREAFLRECIGRFRFKLILNQFRKNSDNALGDKIETVCNRHFYSQFEYLGSINFDDRVSDALLKSTLFAHKFPDTMAVLSLKHIAQKLIFSKTSQKQLAGVL
jgi:flagellar biosynthesis protein FlhG